MTIIIFFILGLIIGSFLNVVVYRLNIAETLLGRSYCPKCKNKIVWYDNIPVLSFILLRASCRKCKKKISWQYPLVEILTGIIFAIIGVAYFSAASYSTWIFVAYLLIISSLLLVILIYDFLYLEIPMLVFWPAISLAIIFNLYFDWADNHFGNYWLNQSTTSGVIASAFGFVFFFSLVVFSKEEWMGMGDVYLVVLLGLILGWPQILMALFLAFSIGAVCGIILIGFKKKTMTSQVPFAPFLIIGTFITLFFYNFLLSWYLSFFRLG